MYVPPIKNIDGTQASSGQYKSSYLGETFLPLPRQTIEENIIHIHECVEINPILLQKHGHDETNVNENKAPRFDLITLLEKVRRMLLCNINTRIKYVLLP